MPAYDYIPSEDESFRTWAEAFRDGIVANPGAFMLSPSQAASIQSVVDDSVEKLALASNEATRTKVTIEARNQAHDPAAGGEVRNDTSGEVLRERRDDTTA